jgi:hypothetical protein
MTTIYPSLYDAFNAPLANASVRAFDKDLRSEQQLGETLTNAQGFHKINYNSQQFAVAEENAADLLPAFVGVVTNIEIENGLLL